MNDRGLLRIHVGLKCNPPTAYWCFLGENATILFNEARKSFSLLNKENAM